MHMNYWTEIPLCVCCIASACASTFLQRSDDLLNFYQSTRLPPPHLTLSFSLIQISISSLGGLTLDVLDEIYSDEPHPHKRLSDWAAAPSEWTTMAGLDPELSNPETLSVSEGSTLPPYPCWPMGALCTKWDPAYWYHGRSLGDWGELRWRG